MQEKHGFQVVSTPLLCPCQDVAAYNTSQLSFVARLIKHAPSRLCFYYQAGTWRLYNVVSTSMQRHDVASTLYRRCIDVMCLLDTFFLKPFRSHLALTELSPGSHCALRDLINSSPRTLKVVGEDKKGTNRGSTEHNLAPVLIPVLPLRQSHESNGAFCRAARNYRSI